MGEGVRTVRLPGAADLAPGSMKVVDVEGRRVALWNVGGTYYATGGTCTHRAATLAASTLDGPIATCGWHGSKFDVRTGVSVSERPPRPLPVYRISVEGADILLEWPG